MKISRTTSRNLLSLTLLLLPAMLFAQQGLRVTEPDAKTIQAALSFLDVKRTPVKVGQKTFMRFSLASSVLLGGTEEPRLPAKALYVGLPEGTEINLDVRTLGDKRLPNLDPEPFPPTVADAERERLLTKVLMTRQLIKGLYPSRIAWVADYFTIGSQRVAKIMIAPVQVDFASRQAVLHRSLDIKIRIVAAAKRQPMQTYRATSKVDEQFLKLNLLNYQTAKAWRQPNPLTTAKARRTFSTNDWYNPSSPYLKLYVLNDGLHTVSAADMLAAGVDPNQIDTTTLRLFFKGSEVPIRLLTQNGSFTGFDFLGQWNKGLLDIVIGELTGDSIGYHRDYYNTYSDTSVYWLTWGGVAGRRFPEAPVSVQSFPTATTFRKTVHFEQDLVRVLGLTDYDNTTERVNGEGWYWRTFQVVDQVKNDTMSFTAVFNSLAASGMAHLKVRFQGATQDTGAGRHKVDITINGTTVGTTVFYNKDSSLYEVDFPNALLANGTNQIKLTLNHNDPQTNLNVVYYDWMEITANRTYDYPTTETDQQDFTGDGSSQQVSFALTGIAAADSLSLFNTTDSTVVTGVSVAGSTATFAGFANKEYLAVKNSKKYKPILIRLNPNSNIRNPSNEVDYIVITHPSFLSAANQLAQYRSGRGLRTRVVTTEQIYNEFNYGIFSPVPIRDYLQYIYERQSTKPKYVVLMGGSNWDYRLVTGTQVGKLPWIPVYGSPFSETWFVSFENLPTAPYRNIPRMFIGRITAQSAQEATDFVSKIIQYESGSQPQMWQKNFMFITGGFTQSEQFDFTTYSNSLSNYFVLPPPITGTQDTIYRSDVDNIISDRLETLITNGMRNGTVVVNYVGHAGSRTWDLALASPAGIQNNYYPAIFSWTCFTGEFAAPDSRSFGEEFTLQAPQSGAITWVGTSAQGFTGYDNQINNYVYSGIQDTLRTVGEVFYNAISHVANDYAGGAWNYYAQSIIDHYDLVGDPATQLLLSDKSELAVADTTVRFLNSTLTDAFQPLSIKVFNCGLATRDSVELTIYDSWNSTSNFVAVKDTMLRPIAITDSSVVQIDFRNKSGSHLVKVVIDQQNLIPENFKNDNTITIQANVYSSDAAGSLPLSYWLFPSTATPQLAILTPPAAPQTARFYYFEVDTSNVFRSPIAASPLMPETPLQTTWTPSLLSRSDTVTYFWRGRILTNSTIGNWQTGNFRFSTTAPSGNVQAWEQKGVAQLSQNTLSQIQFSPAGEATVSTSPLTVVLESRCFDFEYSANVFHYLYLIQVGNNIQTRFDFDGSQGNNGLNIVVVDTSNGQVSVDSVTTYALWYDYFYNKSALAKQLAGRINQLTQSQILFAAVKKGTLEPTRVADTLKRAFQMLGSVRQSNLGIDESWVFGGNKSRTFYMEDWGTRCSPSGGCDSVGRTVTAKAQLTIPNSLGTLTTQEIGPSSKWQRLSWEQTLPVPQSRIDVELIGVRSDGTGEDSLLTTSQSAGLDISAINTTQYPKLKLKAFLRAAQGYSPSLKSWRVQYVAAADAALSYKFISVSKDSVAQGESVATSVKLFNLGYASIDSLKLNVSLQNAAGIKTTIGTWTASNVQPDSSQAFSLTIPTAGQRGLQTLSVATDINSRLPEVTTLNNFVSIPFFVKADTAKPKLSILFDGKTILNGAYVVPKPKITVTMSDQSLLLLTDTSSVSLTLNGSPFYYSQTQGGQGADGNPVTGTLSFTPAVAGKNSAVVTFQPQLPDGNYTLGVAGRDVSGIKADSLNVIFQVSGQMQVSSLYNYPNPMKDKTKFAFLLTGSSDNLPTEFKIKIYTVAGRLVRDLDVMPSIQGVGYSSVEWDGRDKDGDQLANGVYIYRVVIRSKDKTITKTEKLAIVR